MRQWIKISRFFTDINLKINDDINDSEIYKKHCYLTCSIDNIILDLLVRNCKRFVCDCAKFTLLKMYILHNVIFKILFINTFDFFYL